MNAGKKRYLKESNHHWLILKDSTYINQFITSVRNN